MGKVLDALATGKLICESEKLGQNTEAEKADDVFFQLAEQLKERVSNSEKLLLDSLLNAELDACQAYGTDRFSYGFRIGVLLMTEVFTSRTSIIETAPDI